MFAVIGGDDLSDRAFGAIVSVGGMSAAFHLYMRWRIIEALVDRFETDPGQVPPQVLQQAMRLIPGLKKSGGEPDNG